MTLAGAAQAPAELAHHLRRLTCRSTR